MTTFIWRPSIALAVNYKPETWEAKFGDGYAQRAPKGLNSNPKKWDVSFDNLDDVTANAIEDFLSAQGATQPFDWTDPRGITKRYLCPEFSRNFVDEDQNAIKAKFEQFFG